MQFVSGYNILVSIDRMVPQIYIVADKKPTIRQLKKAWELQALYEESKEQPLNASYMRIASKIIVAHWPLDFPHSRSCYLRQYEYEGKSGWITIVHFQAPDFRKVLPK